MNAVASLCFRDKGEGCLRCLFARSAVHMPVFSAKRCGGIPRPAVADYTVVLLLSGSLHVAILTPS